MAAWLMTVTHHKAVDLLRRHHSRTRFDVGAVDVDLIDLHATPEEAVCSEVEHARTRAALRSLPECEREVVVLAYFGGLSQRQVAGRLGIPLGTVKSRTLRALSRLRAALIDEVQAGAQESERGARSATISSQCGQRSSTSTASHP
jgi:RNA polymerase sigma-70 factor (ECF subfamily)